jgi:DivIVA domain-containing protein
VGLDRQRIERKDFPIGRRGYDPDEVDRHLSALADEVDELKRSSRRRSESLAAAASEQVRSIVDAAETSAAEIQRQAEDEAREIRSEATNEAQATREQATSQARDYVGNVSESTSTMLERLDAMQNELNALFESLRTGSNRLTADLQLLERNLDEVRDAVAPRPRFEPEPAAVQRQPQPQVPAPAAPAQPQLHDPAGATAALPPREPESPASATPASPPPIPAAQAGDDGAPLEPDPGTRPHGDALAEQGAGAERLAAGVGGVAAERAAAGAGGAGAERAAGVSSEDTESARLVALNMAMDRKPREETERVLAEQFRLADLRGLVDEVYASFET